MLQQCTALTLISLHSKPQRIYTSNLNERSNSRNFSPRRIQCGTSMCAPLVSIKSIFEYVNKVQLPDVCCLEYFAIFFEMMFCSHYLVIRQIFLCLVTISMTQTHSIINKLNRSNSLSLHLYIRSLRLVIRSYDKRTCNKFCASNLHNQIR